MRYLLIFIILLVGCEKKENLLISESDSEWKRTNYERIIRLPDNGEVIPPTKDICFEFLEGYQNCDTLECMREHLVECNKEDLLK